MDFSKALFDRSAMLSFFNRAANNYNEVAILAQEILNRSVERLQFIKINPKRILDLGCGTGLALPRLAQRYGDAVIVAIDNAPQMLRHAKQSFSSAHYLQGNAYQLPLKTHSIDLLFANFLLPFLDNLPQVFDEWQRILKPNGLMLFSTLGPDTLLELRHCCESADDYPHVYSFTDLHDVGDMLVKAKFIDPVMDQEHITFFYKTVERLLRDLHQQGVQNALIDRRRALMSPRRFQFMKKEYDIFRQPDGLLPATFEVIYGHAFGSGVTSRVNEKGDIIIPLHSLRSNG